MENDYLVKKKPILALFIFALQNVACEQAIGFIFPIH